MDISNISNEEIKICDICGDELKTNITTLQCNHSFHYDCIFTSYKYSKNMNCPYCRQYGGKLKKNIDICCAILKSGKNKGNKCTHKIKIGKYCGKHLNYEK